MHRIGRESAKPLNRTVLERTLTVWVGGWIPVVPLWRVDLSDLGDCYDGTPQRVEIESTKRTHTEGTGKIPS